MTATLTPAATEAADIAWWDAAAANYVQVITGQSDPTVYATRGQKDAERLATAVPSTTGKTLLDWGCGPGRVLKYAAPQYGHVVGVDFSAKMLAVAEALNVANAQYHQIKGGELPLAGQSVDVVYSFCVWMHLWDKTQLPTILGECKRVLKPGGSLVFQLPVYEDAATRAAASPGGINVWTLAELFALLDGWKAVRVLANNGTHTPPTFGPNHFALHIAQAP